MFLFFILFTPLFVIVIKRNNKVAGPNLFSTYIFSFYLYYVIIPALIDFLSFFDNGSKIYFAKFNGNGGMPPLLYCIIVTTFFVILSSSYFNSRSHIGLRSINLFQFEKYIKVIGFTTLIVGGASLLLYLSYLGGILQGLAMAEMARSMATDMTEYLTPMQVRLIVPARTLVLTPYCFLYLYQLKNKKNYLIYFYASVLLAFLFLLFNASRTNIAVFFLAFAFPILSRYTKRPWTLVIVLGLLGSNVLNVLDALFVSFNEDSDSTIADFNINEIVMQFSFAQRNVLYAFEIVSKFGCRYCLDLITSFLNFIPGIHFEPSTEPTCVFFGGTDWRLMGGIPNDVITYSILEGHLIGLLLFPVLISKIIIIVDNSLKKISIERRTRFSTSVFSAYLMLSFFFCIPSADLSSIISNYTILVYFYILFRINKLCRKQYSSI